MRIGRLKHSAWLQSPTVTNDDGEVTHAWTTEATRRVAYQPLSGKELMQGGQMDSRATARVRMRYYSGMLTTWRIVLLDADGNPDKTLHIESVINVHGLNRELELMCIETEEPGGGSIP